MRLSVPGFIRPSIEVKIVLCPSPAVLHNMDYRTLKVAAGGFENLVARALRAAETW